MASVTTSETTPVSHTLTHLCGSLRQKTPATKAPVSMTTGIMYSALPAMHVRRSHGLSQGNAGRPVSVRARTQPHGKMVRAPDGSIIRPDPYRTRLTVRPVPTPPGGTILKGKPLPLSGQRHRSGLHAVIFYYRRRQMQGVFSHAGCSRRARRYCAGVMPATSRKWRVKWLWSAKPSSEAISAQERVVVSSRRRASSVRRRLTCCSSV